MSKNKWFLNGGRGSGKTVRLICEVYENKIADLEVENVKLKDRNKALEQYADLADAKVDEVKSRLAKAIDLIKNIVRVTWGSGWNYSLDWKVKAEQFLEDTK